MPTYDQVLELFNNISLPVGALTLIGAVITMVGNAWRTRVWRTTQRELAANQIFQSYLQSCQTYPRLAAPGIFPIDDRSEDWIRYMYFITAMLHAFETLLQVSGKDELWKTALKTHLHYHRRYFITPRFAPTLVTYVTGR